MLGSGFAQARPPLRLRPEEVLEAFACLRAADGQIGEACDFAELEVPNMAPTQQVARETAGVPIEAFAAFLACSEDAHEDGGSWSAESLWTAYRGFLAGVISVQLAARRDLAAEAERN